MAKVGEEIESVCGKCGDVWHVVAAMIGSKVVKVVCKRCGSQHRHRPPTPGGAAGASAPAEAKAPAAKEPKSKSSKSKASAATEPAARVEADLSKPVRPYRVVDTYKPRERVEHRTFGLGVVEELAGAGKIHVRFETGVKTLLHGTPPAA